MRFRSVVPFLGLGVLSLVGCTGDDPESETASSDEALVGSNAIASQSGTVQATTGTAVSQLADPTFAVHALGRMCIDVGGEAYWAVGAPATLYWCNGSAAQQLAVREVSGGFHDVNLRVGANFCIGARGGAPVAGAVLELQICNGSDAQEFALDGDSIIAGHRKQLTNAPLRALSSSIVIGPPVLTFPINRELVVKPQSDMTAPKTPLVLGPRALTEQEYLRFYATDGSARAPHSGFVRPTDGPSLVTALSAASWGTVVELADGVYDVATPNNAIAAGVTLRGYRKLTDNGPQITFNHNDKVKLFTVATDDVRITGLRVQGPSADTGADRVAVGLGITDGHRVTVDHTEFSRFTEASMEVHGGFDDAESACPASVPPVPRATPVRLARNFVHHNTAGSGGYGFDSSQGAFTLIEGNTEYMNRHCITSDYRGESGYIAQDNLVLSSAPTYDLGLHRLHDFDVHGSDKQLDVLGIDVDDAWYMGGFAGDYVQIQWNSFLDDNRPNIKIRGQSCRAGLLDGNVFVQPRGAWTPNGVWYGQALINLDTDGDETAAPQNFSVTANNAWNSDNPTNDLAVADLDGDGIDDVFMGTGVGWYYSSGGQGEWRYLRRATEKASQLRFGDLDGDGRADVIAVHSSGSLDVSWGGVSDWQFLTRTPAAVPITSFTIGNFDGDTLHGSDVFMTTGAAWYVAPGGHGFAPAQTSSFPMSNLRFGDFDGDGRTDVFAISGGKWSVSYAAQSSWTPLNGPSTSNLDGIIIGDFNGDGVADVGRQYVTYSGTVAALAFDVSLGGRGSWSTVRHPSISAPIVLAGRFEGGARADVLWWSEFDFVVAPGLTANGQTWSRQDMR